MQFSKKVIFLVPVWGGGGGERVISDLSLHLPDHIEKIIVAFENKNYYPYRGRIISLHVSLSTNPILKLFSFVRGYFKFKSILALEKPDYVISFGSLQNMINLLTFKKSIVRVDNPIAISHQKLSEKLYPLFVRIFFNKAYKIIVVSEGLKRELVEKFNIQEKNINVFYNLVDIAKIQKMAQEDLEPMHYHIFSHPLIINIGSLIGQKGQADLIKAFKSLKEKITDAKLVILGEGGLEDRLKKITKDLGLEKDVHFLGWQKNPFKFIARSKVFALPSLWEGFGIVMLEAMACGTPVVAFDCPFGPREILAPELNIDDTIQETHVASCGVLVPVGREDSLAGAISSVMEDQSVRHRIIHSAAARVKEFTIEKFLSGYQFLWE